MRKTLFLVFILFCTRGAAQVFPIQVSMQLVPPYSPWLSDYTMPGAHKLMVSVRANDLTVADYPFRLRFVIEGQGITIRTKLTPGIAPMILQGGGISQVYDGADLSDYFNLNALDFSGMSRTTFMNSPRLPEGFYRFTVSVLDYNRGTVVSNTAMATAWITLNDPPILNTPANASTQEVRDPTNILFSWTPRHTGSPNAAFSTEYTFRLVEIWPDGANPSNAFLTLPPLFEVSTSQNQLRYTQREPALIPGRSYAWQVTARDTEDRDLFRNGGRSEVFSFQYGKELPVPERFQLRWAKPTTLSMRWDPVTFSGDEVKYRLLYRPLRRQKNHEWYETLTEFTQKTLYHLAVDTEYEMKVRAETATQESAFSPVRVFRTLREEPNEFVCRDLVEPPPRPADTMPVFPLLVNDTLHAGGYEVLVRDVVQMDGRYYGSGVAIVPWLNSARVRVTFEGIAVNDRFWLTRGAVKSVWSAGSRFLPVEEIPLMPGTAPKAGALDITVVSVDSLINIEDATIVSVTKDEEGNVAVTLSDEKQYTLAKGESYAVTDAVGNGYVVDKDGNVAKTTATEAKAAASRGQRDYETGFVFARGNGRFGFDEMAYDALSHYYQQRDDGTHVAWKALSSTQPDELEGRLLSGEIDLSELTFEAGHTPVMPVRSDGRRVTLSLQGKAAGMEEEFIARYQPADTIPPKVYGQVNLATYDPIHNNLVIVPVNGVSLPAGLTADVVSEGLNKIFMQAVAGWHVSISEGVTVDLPDAVDVGETGVFSNYTSDMKSVLNAYGHLQDNTYYIFLIDHAANANVLGYMPRGRQAGFVFLASHNGDTAELLKTIGHELGHGAFNLAHTFLEYSLPTGTTDNLMDYGSGTVLSKYQWDHIHEPRSRLSLFGGGEEQEMQSGPLAVDVTTMSLHASYYAVDGGLIPEHLWRSGMVDPVVAGFVDGMWETIEGAWGIANFLDAWQPNNFSADALQIRVATWQFVQFLNTLATSVEARNQVWTEVKSSFAEYIDEAVGFDNEALYHQGRLIFDVASLFVGVGEMRALLKGQRITVGIVSVLSAVPKHISRFIFKARRLGLSVVKDTRRFLIKDGATRIATISDDVLHPEVFFDEGKQMLAHGNHIVVRNSEGRMGFLRSGEVTRGEKTIAVDVSDLTGIFSKLAKDVQRRINELPLTLREEIISDLSASPDLAKRTTVAMVDGWEVLARNSILRRRPKNLEILGDWISKGVAKEKLIRGLTKSSSKQKLINSLADAKSKVHVSVLIKDYDNIPGIVKGRYVPNGSTLADKASLPEGWERVYDVPSGDLLNFTGQIEPLILQPGDKVYRASSIGGSKGPWWSRTKPTHLKDVIGGLAVQPRWNNLSVLFEYTVPDGVEVKCWVGRAARQMIGENRVNYHLPGGSEQVYIRFIDRQDKNFDRIVIEKQFVW